jgi:hypothetical protein
MDPYLEGIHWTGFHATLGIEIVRQLAPKLRPRYVALPVERMVLENPEGIVVTTTNMYPDVSVVEWSEASSTQSSGATVTAPLQIATIIPTAIPHLSIEVRDTAERRLVTAIEILSPTNKRGDGREEYLTKRQRLLLSTTHLVEIDLLHVGQRVPMQQPLPPTPYFVFVSRSEKRPIIDVWPIAMSQSLPTVWIPLLPGDDDVTLDLQSAFNAAYNLVGYDLILDYSRAPEAPLIAEELNWVEQRLRVRG